MRILVVEDTPEIAKAVTLRLSQSGHAVDCVHDGPSAADLLDVQAYDLLILDLSLPGMDGISLLKRLRSKKSQTPVLVITARSAIDERVSVLDLGADDYLTKPFDYRELEARARALLRRGAGQPDNLIVIGKLVVDCGGRLARIGDQPLPLTRREFAVLEILASRSGRIVPKEDLVEHLFSFDQDASANAVEQFVTRLRRKAGEAVEIRALRGLGYQLVPR